MVLIEWNDVTKFISGFVIPILFGIIVILFFVKLILRKHKIESWEDLKNLVRFTVIETVDKNAKTEKT